MFYLIFALSQIMFCPLDIHIASTQVTYLKFFFSALFIFLHFISFSMDDVFGPLDPLKSWRSAPVSKTQNSERDRIKRALCTS